MSQPADRIELRGLRVLGTHGALAEERDRAQPFEVDLDVETDLEGPAASDRLCDAVDYGAVVAATTAVVENHRYELLEALASAVAAAVLALPDVARVTVAVRKLRPPVAADLGSAGVRLSRHKERPGPAQPGAGQPGAGQPGAGSPPDRGRPADRAPGRGAHPE